MYMVKSSRCFIVLFLPLSKFLVYYSDTPLYFFWESFNKFKKRKV